VVFGAEVYRKRRGSTDGSGIPISLWQTVKPLLALSCLTLIVGLSLSAFFLVPAVMERGLHHLFPPGYPEQAIQTFSYRNPLYLFDRNGTVSGWLGDLPKEMRIFPGQLYAGWFRFYLRCWR